MKIEVRARVARGGAFRLDVEFACAADALGLVGPSGSGKTSLLDAIAGVAPGARVVLDGEDLSELPLHRRRIGYVMQDAPLFPHLTIRENLRYAPEAAAGPAGALAEVAGALGLAALLDRMPRNLSGGERRRAALARAILARPRLLLLDEPFGGLDDLRRREAMSLLDQARRRFALPMVLVSHLPEEVIGLTGMSLRLDAGRLAASGPSAAVLRASETRIDNFLLGEVTGPGRVRVGGVELAAALPEGAAGPVRLGCYAHDVILARGRPEGLSARNVTPVTVTALTPAGGAVLVEVAPPPLRVLVTADAARALALAPGVAAWAVLKATSLEWLGPA